MTKTISVKDAKGLYNNSVTELADALDYSRNAIYKMGDNLSERAYLKLRYQLKPEHFDSHGRFHKRAKPS